MTFFVDTNVIVYAATTGPYRDACVDLVRSVAAGQAAGQTSTAVLEEVWHVELSGRAGELDGLARDTFTIFTPVLAVTDEIVKAALDLPPSALGANDRIHVSTCAHNEIGTIVTADSAFDGVRGVRRVDPLDRSAVSRLLSGS